MNKKVNKKLFIKYITVFLLAAFFVLKPCRVLAEIDSYAHWPVEVSANWNAVYGGVTGIELESGDSVGMFDKAGHCYGAGLFNGTRFFLSAFKFEAADLNVPGDIVIPGFKDGDEVVFKAYKKDEAREYVLVLSSGSTYNYVYWGQSSPIRINLVYEGDVRADPVTEPDDSLPEEETESPASDFDDLEDVLLRNRIGQIKKIGTGSDEKDVSPENREGEKANFEEQKQEDNQYKKDNQYKEDDFLDYQLSPRRRLVGKSFRNSEVNRQTSKYAAANLEKTLSKKTKSLNSSSEFLRKRMLNSVKIIVIFSFIVLAIVKLKGSGFFERKDK